MAKNWKKLKGYYFDIGNRDAPVILISNYIYIGTFEDTHSSLIQKVLYGMDGEVGTEDTYMAYSRNETSDDFNEKEILYGNLVGDNIYWDTYIEQVSISDMSILINRLSRDEYNHYRLNSRSKDREAILIRRRSR